MKKTAAFPGLCVLVLAGCIPLPGQTTQDPPAPETSRFQRIEMFEIDPGRQLSWISTRESRPIHEIINPFAIRKRARTYGSLYEYHRNDNLDARNFFDPAGRKLPEYKRNQFGGSLGFALTTRVVLFGTYDGLRINRGSTLLSHVPTPEMKRGDFSSIGTPLRNPFSGEYFKANQMPTSMFHPSSVKMLPLLPDPNSSDPYRNFLNNQPEIENRNTFGGRADYELSKESKIFANYRLVNGDGFDVHPIPAFGLSSRYREQRLTIDYVKNFGPRLVTSVQAGFSREAGTELSPQAGKRGLLASLGIAGLSTLDDLDEGYPDFEISGYASLGSGDSPRASYSNEYSLELGATYVRNNHSLAFGAEIEAIQINNDRTGGLRRGVFEFSGSYTGDAFADFLLGIPNTADRGVGSDRADVRRRSIRAFARDSWKINRKLTLSGTLAYNYFPFSHSIHDNVTAFVPLLFEPPLDGRIVRVGSSEAHNLLPGLKRGHAVYTDKNDWEPRFGIAYSPQGNNRLVIRASYQISYSQRDPDESLDVLGRNYPTYYTERAESPSSQPVLNLSNPFMTAVPTEIRIRGVDPHMRNSYSQEWQLSVQNEIYPKWNIEVSYSGRTRTHAERNLLANVPLPGPGLLQSRRPNPAFGRFSILTSGGSTSGNSLRANLRKRLSRGYSVEAGYEWSRTFSYSGSGEPANPRNLRAERAPGNSPPQSFNLNFIYDLPVGRGQAIQAAWAGKLIWLFEGWRVSGIASYQTGGLFHPRLSGDANNDGVWGDRPDRIGRGNLDKSARSIDRWFATEAFVTPPKYGFGNSGRNILVGPGRRKWDVSFIKRTRVRREGEILELRVQLFNAWNHTNFQNPRSTVGTTVFGRIFGADRAREIEVALKYTF